MAGRWRQSKCGGREKRPGHERLPGSKLWAGTFSASLAHSPMLACPRSGRPVAVVGAALPPVGVPCVCARCSVRSGHGGGARRRAKRRRQGAGTHATRAARLCMQWRACGRPAGTALSHLLAARWSSRFRPPLRAHSAARQQAPLPPGEPSRTQRWGVAKCCRTEEHPTCQESSFSFLLLDYAERGATRSPLLATPSVALHGALPLDRWLGRVPNHTPLLTQAFSSCPKFQLDRTLSGPHGTVTRHQARYRCGCGSLAAPDGDVRVHSALALRHRPRPGREVSAGPRSWTAAAPGCTRAKISRTRWHVRARPL